MITALDCYVTSKLIIIFRFSAGKKETNIKTLISGAVSQIMNFLHLPVLQTLVSNPSQCIFGTNTHISCLIF